MKFSLIIKSALLIALSLSLNACQSPKTSEAPLSIVNKNTPKQSPSAVFQLVESYSHESLAFNPIQATFIGVPGYNHQFIPPISQTNRDKYTNYQQKYLHKAQQIDASKLTGQDLLTYQIFVRDLKMSLAGNEYPAYQIPLNQMYGVHNFFAQLGSGQSAQPFNTEQDYRNFMQRAKGFAKWIDSAITAMKNGTKVGVVQPKAIVKKILPQLKTHIVSDVKESLFYAPLKKLPKDLSEKQKAKLVSDYSNTIAEVIVPSYKKMFDFLQDEYLVSARDSFGYSELPNGKAWYEHMIKTHTTLNLTADEIHEFGLKEVSRILSEMKKVKQTVNFKGDLAAFFEFLRTDDQFYFDSKEALIEGYTNIKHKIDATLPKLFEVFPKADYEVRAVPEFRAASAAGASYQGPAPDGSRPGIFYINAHNLKSQPKFLMETLSIHEAAPGHHFQIAIQQELKGLPSYRKFGGYTVFSEGWALYAESLGKELGLFTDPYMWYGRLVDEQLRAMRLVVDTGLHAKGWSRQQAIDYMLANSSMAASDVEAEVERYIVIPGQALSYKIGQRKIRELRQYAEKTLGQKFNIKKFHTQILSDGGLPMPILEAKIKQWVANQ